MVLINLILDSNRLQDGDCVVFDNLRVLHGRAGFTIKQNDDGQFDTIGRHLQGEKNWKKICKVNKGRVKKSARFGLTHPTTLVIKKNLEKIKILCL